MAWLAVELTAAGGLALLCGLLSSFYSFRIESGLLGDTRLGYAQWAAREGSPRDVEARAQRARADRFFRFGFGLTAFGVVLQTAGSVLSAWPK